MKFKYGILIILLAVVSCKKDRLKNEKAIFIGDWKWIYSEVTGDFCSGNPTSTTIRNPSTIGNNFYMNFCKKGKVTFSDGNGEISEKRIVFYRFQAGSSVLKNSYLFNIYLDNDEDSVLSGEINQDTIMLETFFPFSDNPCSIDRSYFIRN